MSDQNGHARRSVCGLPKVDGTPCGQVVGPRGCLWHGTPDQDVSPEERRAIAKRGAAMAAIAAGRVLAPESPAPMFQSRDEIVSYAENRAHLVETGQLDPKLSAEATLWRGTPPASVLLNLNVYTKPYRLQMTREVPPSAPPRRAGPRGPAAWNGAAHSPLPGIRFTAGRSLAGSLPRDTRRTVTACDRVFWIVPT